MITEKILLFINKMFPLPEHPFNLQNEGKMSYGEWQFSKGAEALENYVGFACPEEMFKGKTVLDIGCGAAGKSVYYASAGAEKVYGTDIVSHYKKAAETLAKEKCLSEKFEFKLCDAKNLDFAEETFDTIIMNDSMEHVAEPEEVLEECFRVLKPKGRLFINFCPYFHPYGAHLSDVIGIPWVHMLFSQKTMIRAYKYLVRDMPDKNMRIKFRFSADEKGRETISYINKMTIKRFNKILRKIPLKVIYRREIPLRKFLMPLAKLPFIKEMFVKMVAVILEK